MAQCCRRWRTRSGASVWTTRRPAGVDRPTHPRVCSRACPTHMRVRASVLHPALPASARQCGRAGATTAASRLSRTVLSPFWWFSSCNPITLTVCSTPTEIFFSTTYGGSATCMHQTLCAPHPPHTQCADA
eukprot:357798-Chlamydomonas_euryale.AAC.22